MPTKSVQNIQWYSVENNIGVLKNMRDRDDSKEVELDAVVNLIG